MMLCEAVSRVLYPTKHISLLFDDEVEICNKFIDDYNKVTALMSGEDK